MQIQFMRSKQTIYELNDKGKVEKSWPCHDAFIAGHNENGQPRESLPNGVYSHTFGELYSYGKPYGTFYINTGDIRGRDIHGGGSGLPDPFAPRQGWVPTYGCLRMQNEDGEELVRDMMANGNDILLEVVNE